MAIAARCADLTGTTTLFAENINGFFDLDHPGYSNLPFRLAKLVGEHVSLNEPFSIAAIALLHAGGAARIVLKSEDGQLAHHQWFNL